ncbi:MAG: hypothetical protein BGP13_08510 [Sphingobacteriales bacterium 40-81]|nr:MAG: hypothetical protein BGP13_08510 [Sphingobacteriales bacterium 40-81]
MQLSDSLDEQMKAKIDYNGAILTKLYNDSLKILRIPVTGSAIENEFVLLRIEEDGKILEGRIVEIEQISDLQDDKINNPDNAITGTSLYPTTSNGRINMQHINGTHIFQSTIINGYINEWHKNELLSARVEEDIDVYPIKPAAYKVLPEVVITASSGGGGGYSYTSWYSLGSFFYGSSVAGGSNSYTGSSISAYYSSANGSSSTSAGGGNAKHETKDNYIREDKPMLVDFELLPEDVIDVNIYLRCFDLLPDAGANCSIELFTDIPVDGKPMAGFDVQTGSPGHTFLQISKSSNGQRITQNIGFYPASPFKTLLTTAPIDGVFADNQYHEFNASLKMTISAEQLKIVIDQIKRVARYPKYDIDDYNCTDFALNVFNSVRGINILEIPKLDIPQTMNPYGSNTPQGVYLKLKEMKSKNSTEANNITIPGAKGYAGQSHGSCN